MKVNEEAIKAINVIVSAIEQELPEWEVILRMNDGTHVATIYADVCVGKGPKRFCCQQQYDYRELSQSHPAMLPSRGIDLALKWRDELRKAKKDVSKFGA